MEETAGFLNIIIGLLHRERDLRYLALALIRFIFPSSSSGFFSVI